ncbi:MAG: dihydropteroate synthase [Verrucomicrobia bacterium]|nr:dihydropteroate synthase [Verrucomicrobiota bacterium]
MNASLRSQLTWQCREKTLHLGARTLIMGILNVTPDSFSDGGRFSDVSAAVARALEMEQEGTDIIDIGGESSRPGSARISEEEELRRVMPVVEGIIGRVECLVSIDTMKAGVADRAMEAGAHIINDVSALTADELMPDVALRYRPGLVLMHMQATPETMQENPVYEDVVSQVAEYLRTRIADLASCGIAPESIVVDPGIGFGKTLEHNLALLNGIGRLGGGRPVLVGASRKRFIGSVTGREVEERLAGSLAAMSCAILRGAHIMRVHDVKESCDAALIVDKLIHEQARHESSETDSIAGMDGNN